MAPLFFFFIMKDISEEKAIIFYQSTSNQIYLVTFMCLTIDTSFIFTKNYTLQNVLLISLNTKKAVPPKIRRHFSNKMILELKLSKNIFYKKCGPELIFFNEKKIERFG